MRRYLMAIMTVLICLGFVGLGWLQAAEKYPVKPISCIIGLEAGADGDVMVPPILAKMSQKLGQPIVGSRFLKIPSVSDFFP